MLQKVVYGLAVVCLRTRSMVLRRIISHACALMLLSILIVGCMDRVRHGTLENCAKNATNFLLTLASDLGGCDRGKYRHPYDLFWIRNNGTGHIHLIRWNSSTPLNAAFLFPSTNPPVRMAEMSQIQSSRACKCLNVRIWLQLNPENPPDFLIAPAGDSEYTLTYVGDKGISIVGLSKLSFSSLN